MFPAKFLYQIAREHGLSYQQEQVFLMRFQERKSYEEIAKELETSADACLKRMGLVYKKLNIDGNNRGKENKLRIFLLERFEKWQEGWENRETELESVQSNLLSQPTSQEQIYQNNQIYQNLPAREYTAFIGRDKEIIRLMELLDDKHSAHLISIDGIGGVGKTTLVVEVAYRCLEAGRSGKKILGDIPTFTAIIFASAKQNHLTSMGIIPRLTFERTLRDICREIARTLDITEMSNLPLSEQIDFIRHQLSFTRTLLIIDNLETIEDKQDVLSFLYDLPPTVKVIMTTREQALFVPIRLGCLSREHGLGLIQHESREKGVNLDEEQARKLFEGVSGIPAAIIYAIGQMAAGYLLSDVLAQIKQPDGDIARFFFAGALAPLRGNSPHYLLMALSLFVQPVVRETIADIAFEAADPIDTARGLAQLQQLSLVFQNQGRYSLLELTREYALAELVANREFAQNLRQRWVSWYVNFSEDYGGKNWKEWHLDYGYLEAEWENLRAVLEWCMSHGRYTDAKAIWQRIKGYIHVRGFWDERLDWTAWLIEAAKQSADWAFAAEVMSDRSRTLVHMRYSSQLEEAEQILQAAWELRHHQTMKFQLELATNMVVLSIQQEKWQQACDWLKEEEKLLAQAPLPESEKKEQQIHMNYYQGQIYFKTGKIESAKLVLQQALTAAQTAGWQRATAAIQNWLAVIALELEDLEAARQLLNNSLPMAQRHKDKRCIAFHQATLAKLEKKSGNIKEAKHWAKEAATVFESLKMLVDAQEMRNLLAMNT